MNCNALQCEQCAVELHDQGGRKHHQVRGDEGVPVRVCRVGQAPSVCLRVCVVTQGCRGNVGGGCMEQVGLWVRASKTGVSAP